MQQDQWNTSNRILFIPLSNDVINRCNIQELVQFGFIRQPTLQQVFRSFYYIFSLLRGPLQKQSSHSVSLRSCYPLKRIDVRTMLSMSYRVHMKSSFGKLVKVQPPISTLLLQLQAFWPVSLTHLYNHQIILDSSRQPSLSNRPTEHQSNIAKLTHTRPHHPKSCSAIPLMSTTTLYSIIPPQSHRTFTSTPPTNSYHLLVFLLGGSPRPPGFGARRPQDILP